MARADHHANNVDEVALAIAGAVDWREEGEIEGMTREGDMKNVLWVRINGNLYALLTRRVPSKGCRFTSHPPFPRLAWRKGIDPRRNLHAP